MNLLSATVSADQFKVPSLLWSWLGNNMSRLFTVPKWVKAMDNAMVSWAFPLPLGWRSTEYSVHKRGLCCQKQVSMACTTNPTNAQKLLTMILDTLVRAYGVKMAKKSSMGSRLMLEKKRTRWFLRLSNQMAIHPQSNKGRGVCQRQSASLSLVCFMGRFV